jgi:plasmid stability protein
MTRLTITLPDDLHRALKQESATRGRAMADLIAESLVRYGIKPEESVRDLVERARRRSGLDEAEALALATTETRAAREV